MAESTIDAIEVGMLSSPQIKYCVLEKHILKLPADDQEGFDQNCFKSATYDMRLGDFAVRFENGIRLDTSLWKVLADEKKYLVFAPNSLTFITTYEEFALTRDIIARFNLKTKFVHRGLILGTGPMVDPEFHGKLLIPIHNFSNTEVKIPFKDRVLSVEFTKTLDTSNFNGYDYVENKNKYGDPEKYLKNIGEVESCFYQIINEQGEKIKKQTEQLKEQNKYSSEFIKSYFNKYRKLSIVILIASVIIFAFLWQVMNNLNTTLDNLLQHNINLENKLKDFRNKLNDDKNKSEIDIINSDEKIKNFNGQIKVFKNYEYYDNKSNIHVKKNNIWENNV